MNLEWQLPCQWGDTGKPVIRFRAQAHRYQKDDCLQQDKPFTGENTVTGRIGQEFIVCARQVDSDDFVQSSTVADTNHLYTLIKETGHLSIIGGTTCPDWLARQYPFGMTQRVRSTEPFLFVRRDNREPVADQPKTQTELTLLLKFDSQPPVELHVSQAEYPEMAEHLLSARQLLQWLVPRLNGREAFVQQLMDIADNITETSLYWNEETLHNVQQQIMIAMEQPDTEFSLEFERHWLNKSLAVATGNREQVNLAPSQPPEAETLQAQDDNDGFFTLIVGGKRFLIDRKQLDPEKRGREDPADIKAFARVSPDQHYLLTMLEQSVFEEKEKGRMWLADDNTRTTLDYLCEYGTATTKEALWRYYPVYAMAMPESEKYHSPVPFYADAEHDQNCGICLDYFFQQGEAVKTPCRHLYCAHCLKNLMAFQSACPKCRHPVKLPTPLEMEVKFAEAATTGDLHGLSLLHGLGVDINQQDADGNTALHLAYHYQHRVITEFLLSNGADKNQRNNAGLRPIDLAAETQQENLAMQAELLEQQLTLFEQVAQGKAKRLAAYLAEGGNPNQQDPENLSTLLHIAVEHNQHELVDMLLQCPDIEVDKANRFGYNPLMEAAREGNEVLAARLLEQGASQLLVNKDGMNPLMFAAQNGHLAVTVQLVKRLPESQKPQCLNQADLINKRTALIMAAQHQHSEIAEFLLEQGASIYHQDTYGMNALMYAARNRNLHLIRLIAKLESDVVQTQDKAINAVNDHHETALENAAFTGDKEVVQCLLEVGAAHGYSMISAAGPGHMEVVKVLVAHGVDINGGNDYLMSPLSLVVDTGGLPSVVQEMIGLGADVNFQNDMGSTPLCLAILTGNLKIVRKLIQNGADVYSRAMEESPLYLALCALTVGLKYWQVTRMSFIKSIADQKKRDFKIDGYQMDADLDSDEEDGWVTPPELTEFEERGQIVWELINHDTFANSKAHLPIAAGAGHMDMFQELFSRAQNRGADINYNSLLLAASEKGQEEVVHYLLSKCNDIDINFDALLSAAAAGGCLEVVRLCIDKEANVNLPGEHGTPLELAAKEGHGWVVDYLIEKGADVNLQGKQGAPLELAAGGGYVRIIQLLIDKGADINFQGKQRTPLEMAVVGEDDRDFQRRYCGRDSVVSLLIRSGADVNLKGEQGTPLEIAAQMGKVSIVDHLINSGANVNIKGLGTPLERAAARNQLKVIHKLLLHKANINQVGGWGTPLEVASREGYVETVEVLINNGADVNLKGVGTPLEGAAAKNQLEVIRKLVLHGANINQKGRWGTPLEMAVQEGHVEAIDLLVNNGASVNHIGDRGTLLEQTCDTLQKACDIGNPESVRKLISGGADVNLKGRRTPLEAAALFGRLEIVQALVDSGADVNLKGKWGTPVDMSAAGGHLNVTRLLIANGACWADLPAVIKACSLDIFRELITQNMLDVNSVVSGVPLLVHLLDTDVLDEDATNKARILLENCANPQKNILNPPAFSKHWLPGRVHALPFVSDEAINNYCLFTAARDGNIGKVKKRLNKYPHLNTGNALFYACLKGHREIAKLLLQRGAEPNFARLTEGDVPLHGAIRNNHPEVIRLLLDAGADPTLKTFEGKAPLDIAGNHCHAKTQKLLVNAVHCWRPKRASNEHVESEALPSDGVSFQTDFAPHKAIQDGVVHELSGTDVSQ